MATSAQKAKSQLSTLRHILEVSKGLQKFATLLLERAEEHDESKLEEPELSGFAEAEDLSKIEYDSDEYKASLKLLEETLAHHYSKNRHHPGHWPNGIDDMDLVDLVEMFVDWSSSSGRNLNGNLLLTLNKNAERFKMSDQLTSIFRNTIERYFE